MKPIKQSKLFDTISTVLGLQKTKARQKQRPIVTRHSIAEQKRKAVRILLAEDNPMNQKLAVILLRRAGYSVHAVENGCKAVEALKHTVYNLILMDVQMPVMNGFQATNAIRQMEDEKKHIPIIAMTAHAMKGDKERCLQAGMDDYVSKPIEPRDLFRTIDQWTKSDEDKEALPRQAISKQANLLMNVPLNLENALNRFGGDRKFFQKMLAEFLDYVPKQLKTLDDAVKKADSEVAGREAHSLKGLAAQLGAERMADLALEIELSGEMGNLAGAEQNISKLTAELTRLEEYVAGAVRQEIALRH